MDYYSLKRDEMFKFIPDNTKTLLEVGCGAGNFGSFFKTKGMEVWGVEPNKESAEKASKKLFRVLNRTFDSDIDLPLKYFDCIVFNDVLEHLYDPWECLSFAKKFMKNEDSKIVASVPNFRYWSNLYEIIVKKDFKYKDWGLLDYTHIRFFTKKTIEELFSKSGYEICVMEGINPSQSLKFKVTNTILLNSIKDMRYQQYAVVAKCKE